MDVDKQFKSLNEWNEKKKIIATNLKTPFYKEGDIWWCTFGMNIGLECYGKGIDFMRPVFILKRLSKTMCIVMPITSRKRSGSWFVEISTNNGARWVMLHQIRAIDVSRLQRRIETPEILNKITVKQKLELLLGFCKSSLDK